MEDSKSKTQKKREAEQLQQLGIALTALNENQLTKLSMPDNLRKAIREAKTIHSNAAKRRHAQYIGRLMRGIEDIDSLKEAIDSIKQISAKSNAEFHLAERWRQRLLTEGNPALTEFLAEFHCDDIQNLRHLINQAKKDITQQKNTGAYKALFRQIKTLLS